MSSAIFTPDQQQKKATDNSWEPVIRYGSFVPLQMRKYTAYGRWIYRAPTEEEIQEYLEAEAW